MVRARKIWFGLALALIVLGGVGMIVSFFSTHLFPVTDTSLPNPIEKLAGHPVKKSFKVVVFSDIAQNLKTIGKELDAINETNADFAICNGDIVQSNASENEFAYVQKQLAQKITMPLFLLPGNHDCNSTDGFERYRRFFGKERYFWNYGDTLFIAVNTGSRRFDETEQRFLRETLQNERPKFKRCVLVMHTPPVDLRPNKKRHSIRNAEDINALADIVSTSGINMIVTSHLHWFLQGSFAGVPIFHTPSGGQRVRDPENNHIGYVLMSFEEDGRIMLNSVNVTAEWGRSPDTFFMHIAGNNLIYLPCFFGVFICGFGGIAFLFFTKEKAVVVIFDECHDNVLAAD